MARKKVSKKRKEQLLANLRKDKPEVETVSHDMQTTPKIVTPTLATDSSEKGSRKTSSLKRVSTKLDLNVLENETPSKIQKTDSDSLGLDKLNLYDQQSEMTESSSSKRSKKKKKGCFPKKGSSAVRSLFTASQELMPPPTSSEMDASIVDSAKHILIDNPEGTLGTIPVVVNENQNVDPETLLQKIVNDSAVSNDDLNSLAVNPLLTANSIAAYISYICSIADFPCIAVHPSFSGNFYLLGVGEMFSRDFILNPRGHPIAAVDVVFIPILLHYGEKLPREELERSSGHWVLGIYKVKECRVIYCDPFARPIGDIGRLQLERALPTLPDPISCHNYSVVNRNNLHFNVQPGNDSVNCGYFVCLFVERNVEKKLASNFKVSNFDILIYRTKVWNVLELLLNNVYPACEPVENLFQMVVDEPKIEPIAVDMTKNVEPIVEKAVARPKSSDFPESNEPKICKTRKPAKIFETCQNRHPNDFCASRNVNHLVEYFDSGNFKYKCIFCGAKLLRSEFSGRASRCCHSGQVNLREMYSILQHPPSEMLDMCDTKNNILANEFLNNARKYNSELAFGSIHTVQQEKQGGRGKDICMLNGETSYSLSDLFHQAGQRPVFGQFYALEPKIGEAHRLLSAKDKKLNWKIIDMLENMLRKHNVLASAYFFGSEIYRQRMEECKAKNEQFPKFIMTLLTNRQAKELNAADAEVHTHRTELPTVEQVAVVWLSKDGEPPQHKGVRLYGRKGDYYTMLYYEPNVDPACYPLLFPYGTQGYHYGIEKIDPDNVLLQKALEKKLNAGKGGTKLYTDKDEEFIDDFANLEDNGMDDVLKSTMKRKFMSGREFYRYIFQMREDGPEAYHWLWSKRTLAELFVITTCNKIERHEMDWVRDVQDRSNLRASLPDEFIKAIGKGLKPGETLGKVHLAPPVWTGSRAYMQQQYADAMAMARELGNPAWFLTFTGNPTWPEIQSQLNGQSYTTRPDVVCRVFYDKLTELIKDIKERHVLGKCKGYVYSVEFQKRGMPHIHMLIILEQDPTTKTSEFCDKFVCAEIPDLPDPDDMSEDAEQQRQLHKWVTQLNLHDHDSKAACMADGKCSKYFPKQFSPITILSPLEFPIYKRRAPPGPNETKTDQHGNTFLKVYKNGKTILLDNRFVVGYNPYLILKYRTHLNLEHVAAQESMEYSFKYIMKGHDLAYVRVQGESTVDFDEIDSVLKCRYMAAIEAYWRINGYPIVHKSHPVIRQWIKGPKGQPVIFHEGYEREALVQMRTGGKITMVEAFFELCRTDPRAKTLTYDKVGKHYIFNQKQGKWLPRKNRSADDVIVRVGSVSPRNRELFCVRILLFNRPGPTSFENLQTVDGTVYPTFEEACKILNLLDNDFVWTQTLTDACNERMGSRSFRRFFALCIYHCIPAKPLELLEQFVSELVPFHMRTNNVETDRETALRLLEYLFLQWNTTCELMGLPKPANFDYTHAENEHYAPDPVLQLLGKEQYSQDPEQPDYGKLHEIQIHQMNPEQRDCFDQVSQAVISSVNPDYEGPRLFLLHGSGGTGKTFVYNALITWAKSQGCSVIACASTGIAARLLMNGQTAHSTFGIMNEVGPNQPSGMSFESRTAQKLRSASLFIIDEISMLHRYAFEYIDRVMQSIQYRDTVRLPFGGKVFLIGGDFKQLLPVVKSGSIQDQIDASIKSSQLYGLFKRFDLVRNMRVNPDEVEFCDFLEQVGNGTNFVASSNLIKLPENMPKFTREELIEFCFPALNLQYAMEDIDTLSNAAILAPTNDMALKLNLDILKVIPGQERIYLSTDSLFVPGDNDSVMQHHVGGLQLNVGDNVLENIHKKMPSGFPPHDLCLKEGAIIMLIKNLSVSEGLCNGTRLQILSMGDNLLRCHVLFSSVPCPQVALIPRVKFIFGTSPNCRETPFTRVQFPVRLSFAMTINKSQGQTLSRVGLCLDQQDVFSHGQLYVALSRVRRRADVKILTNANPKNELLMNIVLPEFL